MRFGHDYSAVARWAMEDGGDAVTIETTGWVVRSTFDTNPAMHAGVILEARLFDEVADGPPPASHTRLWQAAAARLKEARRPGRTACLVVTLGDLAGARALVRPWTWDLDGVVVSAPDVPGPPSASVVDERPDLTTGGVPFVLAVAPGPHRLDGGLILFEPGAPPRNLAFTFELVVAPGEEVALELYREAGGPLAVRRP